MNSLSRRVRWTVNIVRNGESAMTYLRIPDDGERSEDDDNIPTLDLVIADCHLPDMSVQRLIERIKNQSSMKNVPFVVLSTAYDAGVYIDIMDAEGTSTKRNKSSVGKGKPHVFVVGGVRDTRKAIKNQINDKCEVSMIATGRMALDELGRNKKVKMVIIDCALPGMSAQELLHTIKESDETKHVHVVILSPDTELTLIDRFIGEGVLMIISRPFRDLNVPLLMYFLEQ